MAGSSSAVTFDAMHHEVTTAVEPPEMVLSWIAQLLDPQFLALMKAVPYDRVDIRLAASKGRVSKAPVVVLNGGSLEFQNP